MTDPLTDPLTLLEFLDLQATVMSFFENIIQLYSGVATGNFSQLVPNSWWILMIIADAMPSFNRAVLIDSESKIN